MDFRLEKVYDVQIRAKLDMKYDGLQLRWLSAALIRVVNSQTPGGASSLEEVHIRVPVSVQFDFILKQKMVFRGYLVLFEG